MASPQLARSQQLAQTLLLGSRLMCQLQGRLSRAACLRIRKLGLPGRHLHTLYMQLREPQLSLQALAKLPSCRLGSTREQLHQRARLTQQMGLMLPHGAPSTQEQPQQARQPHLYLLAMRCPHLPVRERLQSPALDRTQLAVQQQKQRLRLQKGSCGQQRCQQRTMAVQKPLLRGKLWSP